MSKKTEKKQQQKTKLKTALFTFSSVLLIGTLFCTHIDLKKKPTTEYILFLSRSVDLFSSYFFFLANRTKSYESWTVTGTKR